MSNYRNIGSLTIKGVELESIYNSTYLFGSVSFAYAKGQHQGAYTNPWGPDVAARDIPPTKWVLVLGTHIPAWDAQVGWMGQFIGATDRLPSDKYPAAQAPASAICSTTSTATSATTPRACSPNGHRSRHTSKAPR